MPMAGLQAFASAVVCAVWLADRAAALGQQGSMMRGAMEAEGPMMRGGWEVDALDSSGSAEGRAPAQRRFPAPDQIFQQYDRDADGSLGLVELSGLLKGLGFSAEESEQMRTEMDSNNDAQVSNREFRRYLTGPLGGSEDAADQQPETQALFGRAPTQPQSQPQPQQPLERQRSQQPQYYQPQEQPQAQRQQQTYYQASLAHQPVAEAGPPQAPPAQQPASGTAGGAGPLDASAADVAAQQPTQQQQAAVAAAATAAAQQAATQASGEVAPGGGTLGGGAAVAPFGREDTAQELQAHSAKTQDTLIDAVENAEVAEIKRAVFRALTRLRAAQIKEFDTIARLETQAIDEYNDNHHYRSENPLGYLANNEPVVATDKYAAFH